MTTSLNPSDASPVDPVDPVGPGADLRRLVGPDVVRAVALIGVVVMNYRGYLILRGGSRGSGAGWDHLFDPWTGPLSTRFAATFVLTAGVGVTLFTRRAVGDPDAEHSRRWTLVRRGLALYGAGLLLDMVWAGTILPFYGAMFVLSAVLFTLPSAAVVTVGVASALVGAGNAWWELERRLAGERSPALDFTGRSPSRVLTDVFVDGTHPLFPWLMFFCAGIVLGRQLGRASWRPRCTVVGAALFVGATTLSIAAGDGVRAAVLASTDPFDRGLLYTASALGTALLAFAVVSSLADRFAGAVIVDMLRHAGAMTLTLYVAHALAFNLFVDWLGWVDPAGLGTALVVAAAFWAVAITIGWWYHRRFRIGPLERLYRALGG